MSRQLAAQRDAAEGRYARYQRELTDMHREAERLARMGDWSGAANKLQAAVAHTSAMVGVARELSLIYLLWERD
jgi:hypothetical protein